MKDLVTYEEAIKLKELGFNKPCWYYYSDTPQFGIELLKSHWDENHNESRYFVSAPTKDIALEWMKKHNIFNKFLKLKSK